MANAGAVIVGVVTSRAGAAAAAPADDRAMASSCTLTTGNVGYSANMLFVGAWLSGDCHGQVEVDLQMSSSASGPFTTVESTVTYPLNPDAQGGTAWFTDAYQAYGCGFDFRGAGTCGDLTAVSPKPGTRADALRLLYAPERNTGRFTGTVPPAGKHNAIDGVRGLH
jgi:hypothetical protein